jgi:2-O-methyltransferase
MLFLDKIQSRFPNLKTIFEVGAHRGYDIYDIKKLWPNAKIYAFEADPFNYCICRDKFAGDDQVVVLNKAISDYTESSFFYRLHPENPVDKIKDEDTFIGTNLQDSGGGSILKPGRFLKHIKHDDIYQKIPVECISIHDFCTKENIKTVDGLFMDIQGAEFKALYGSRNFLHSIKSITLEWSTEYTYYEGETDFSVIKHWLERNNFKEIDRVYQLKISGDSLFFNLT